MNQISEDRKWAYVNLRISREMLKDVDKAVLERVGIRRTGWVLEAIQEKLRMENEG